MAMRCVRPWRPSVSGSIVSRSGRRATSFVILACHGDGGSIVLPELDGELERHQPFHDGVSPESLHSFARFDGATVVATGCDTGHPALVEAVLGAGASAYVAQSGARSDTQASSPRCSCSMSLPSRARSPKASSDSLLTTANSPCGACTPELRMTIG